MNNKKQTNYTKNVHYINDAQKNISESENAFSVSE